MKPKKKMVAAMTIVALGVSQPTLADCCHDALSCIAAVATGGVSCAVEAAMQEVSGFINRVRSVIDNGQREMNDTLNALRNEADTKMQASQQKVAAGTQRTEQSLQSVNSMGLNLQIAQIQAEYQKVNNIVAEQRRKQAEMQQKVSHGQATRNAGLNNMNQAFQVAFIAPLTGLIAPLVATVDPISAAAAIAILAPQIDNIMRNTESRMASESGSYRNRMEPELRDMEKEASDSEQRARDAEDSQRKLAEMMRQQHQNQQFLTSSATRPAASAAATAPAAAPTMTAVAVINPQLITLNLQPINVSLIPKLRADLQNTAIAARNIKTKTPQTSGAIDLSAYQSRARTDLDRLFGGKAPAQAQQDTTQLLTEARKRYDAATVAKLERYLNEQASARTGASPPTKVAAAPANLVTATPAPSAAPSSPATTTQYVDCAAPQLRVDVTTRLPAGWSHAPSDGALRGARVQTVGNERALVCVYQAYDGQVAVMRKLPAQARDCQVDQTGRRFVCQVAAR